jgi:hypothetical protein
MRLDPKRLEPFGDTHDLESSPDKIDQIKDMLPGGGVERYEHERALAEYLDNGYPLVDLMGASRCVLDPSHGSITGGNALRTDGEWLWREDTSHYVRQHHLLLPERFVRHVEDEQFDVPELKKAALMELEERILREEGFSRPDES